MNTRHRFVAPLLASLITAFAATGMSSTAFAAAPQVKTQAPGYYRMMLGDFEVTALSDGTVGLPVSQLLKDTTPEETAKVLAKSYLKDPVETSVNAYLINTGAKLVLVDGGAGGLFGPTLGKLVASLKAAGYQPEQVDEIYITHMHPDHVGGLSKDGVPVFANAVVRADKRDGEFWLSQANLDKAPDGNKGFFQGAMASMNPYVKAGKFRPYDGNTDLVTGIKSHATYGHTPGHSFFVVESKGEKLVLWGDVIHAASVQFAAPAVTIAFDTDSKAAAAQRASAFAEAADKGYWVAASHLAFPGMGKLRAEGKGYVFIPAVYNNGQK
jgi:glyoxylase-like metal-dependent hydrolase (beta-lactamase superfamily II)